MLRSLAVARIQQGLGFRSDRATEIITALQEEQRDLERGKTLPKFLLLEDQALTLAATANAVALPATFLRRSNILISYISPYSTRPRFIPWRDYGAAARDYGAFNPGGPAAVSIRKSTLWFEPLSDRAYSLTWTYYKKADLLTTDIENAWLAADNSPELLIGGAGLRMALDMRNKDAVQVFSVMQQKARAALFGDTVTEEADDQVTMGGDQ